MRPEQRVAAEEAVAARGDDQESLLQRSRGGAVGQGRELVLGEGGGSGEEARVLPEELVLDDADAVEVRLALPRGEHEDKGLLVVVAEALAVQQLVEAAAAVRLLRPVSYTHLTLPTIA